MYMSVECRCMKYPLYIYRHIAVCHTKEFTEITLAVQGQLSRKDIQNYELLSNKQYNLFQFIDFF